VCPCRFPNVRSVAWVQEEPLNAGAWSYASPHIQRALRQVSYSGEVLRVSVSVPVVHQ
jgi:2-oxoglutarate dehydrogenase complex dehydrogenase (E1) component-like enzyme